MLAIRWVSLKIREAPPCNRIHENLPPVERGDGLHVAFRKLKTADVKVFFDPRRRAAFWDDSRTALDRPSEGHLGSCTPVFLGDRLDDRVCQNGCASRAEGGVGGNCYTLVAAKLQQVALRMVRVQFDLVIADSDAPPQPEPETPHAQTAQPVETDSPLAIFTPRPVAQPQPAGPEAPHSEKPAPETPATDTDHDGVPDEKEDQALNHGDGNGDGTPDKRQPNVASRVSEVTGRPVTLAASGDCEHIHGFDVIAKTDVEDHSYTYPQGLFDFELACKERGQSAEIKLYLDTSSHAGWTWRKFNRFGQTYADVGGRAQFGTMSIGGTTVTTAAYRITDGDSLDEDRAANGIILDPSGPGVPIQRSSGWIWWLLPLGLLALVFIAAKRKTAKPSTKNSN